MERSKPRLDGALVLIVEDEFLIALELSAILSDAGATVIGPAATVPAALALVDDGLSAAILDMRVASRTVTPVAQQLKDRGVPFVFYTAEPQPEHLQAEWSGCRVISKPARPGTIVKALAELLTAALQAARTA